MLVAEKTTLMIPNFDNHVQLSRYYTSKQVLMFCDKDASLYKNSGPRKTIRQRILWSSPPLRRLLSLLKECHIMQFRRSMTYVPHFVI